MKIRFCIPVDGAEKLFPGAYHELDVNYTVSDLHTIPRVGDRIRIQLEYYDVLFVTHDFDMCEILIHMSLVYPEKQEQEFFWS